MTPKAEQEKTYTEKAVILRERAAYAVGRHESLTHRVMSTMERHEYMRDAARRYPLPKVTRPRVVRDRGDYAWKMVDGVLYYSGNGENWYSASGCSFCPTVERIALWSDLLANPTEETDDV